MDVVTLLQGDEASDLTPLFLIHAISGIALPFLRLEPLSDYDERPVYGITSPVHCPGGENFKYPPSLKALAALYLDEVRKVQPEDPYLLGGWSMGGMVAMFMAQALEAMDEEVLKVIMIDSANPEVFPNFSSPDEHREFAKATFESALSAGGLQPEIPSEPPSPLLSAPDYGSDVDYAPMAYSGRFPLQWRSASSSKTTIVSDTSSIFDQGSPLASDGQVLSPLCMSEASDYGFSDDCDSDCDDADDFVRKMELHVYHGLELIAGVEPGQLFVPGQKSNFDAILKCTSEPIAVDRRYADHDGARLIQTVMRERAMRWDPAQFRSFESIPFSGDHDGAFQSQYVGEMSAILRQCVAGLD